MTHEGKKSLHQEYRQRKQAGECKRRNLLSSAFCYGFFRFCDRGPAMRITIRNFISILLSMALLFVLFIGTLYVQDAVNDYRVNAYEPEEYLQEDTEWNDAKANGNAVYFGDVSSDLHHTAEEWSRFRKLKLQAYSGISSKHIDSDTRIVLLQGDTITAGQYDAIVELCKSGVPVVFMDLPESAVIQNSENLREILGIHEVRSDSVQLTGIHLFSGFLLGGETIYQPEDEEEEDMQDLDLEIPWYVTLQGTESWMVGMMEENDDDPSFNEYLPAIIWKNHFENSDVFAINGDYCKDAMTGMGILSASLYQAQGMDLYPVINAQNLSLLNFPEAADENQENMVSIYGRSQTQFQNDIILSSLTSLANRTGFRPSSFFLPQYLYTDENQPVYGMLEQFLWKLSTLQGEMGLSLSHDPGTSMENKMASDTSYLDSQNIGYHMLSAYAENNDPAVYTAMDESSRFQEIRTIVTPYDANEPVISYEGGRLIQRLTSSATDYTYTSDLQLKGLETTLAYSSVGFDILPSLWPKDEQHQWQNYSKRAMAVLSTYWEPFEGFDRTTVTQSDTRARNFLAQNYSWNVNDNQLLVHCEREGDFLLRLLNDTPKGDYQKVEDHTWLLHLKEGDTVINLERNSLLEAEP